MAKITTDMLMYIWAIKRGMTEHDPSSTIYEIGDKVNEAFQTDVNPFSYRRKFKNWISHNRNPKNTEQGIEVEELFATFCKNNKHLIKKRYLPPSDEQTDKTSPDKVSVNQQKASVTVHENEKGSVPNREQKPNHDGLEALRSFFPNGKTAQTYERPTSQNNAGNTQGKTTTAEGVEFDPSKF